MDLALLITAALMGLAGTPHCAAMCGAACVAVGGGTRGWSAAGFQLGRLASYAAAGAVAAGSVQWLGRLGEWTPLFKPLWIAVHVAALMLGAWLLVRGVQPRWVQQLAPFRAAASAGVSGTAPITWSARARGPARAGAAGLLWVAWPCGLLQSALVVAALAGGAAGGAAVMGAFAIASSLGLAAAPWLLGVVARNTGQPARASMTRVAGALLAGASLWALGHGLWHQVAAWCAA